jgi:ABC-2 type transport system ATP-binding protein
MSLLQVNNVSKRYAGHVALDDVSLTIKEGEIFGLLGPNGAGKTSLIRIINQITGPDTGTVYFNGELLNPKHIEQIGYLPEERGLYKKMEVGEQALYLAQLKGLSRSEARAKLKYWFEKFEIQSWWNKKVEELSKGMAQKVQFIVTVLHQPKLLILDEPFSGFDPINANLLKNEILEMRNKGTTVIFSTHNMGSVEELCDSIALINKSKKILDGPVNEIRDQYRENLYELVFKGNNLSFTNALWSTAELIDKPELKGSYMCAKIKLTTHKLNDVLMSIIPFVEVVSIKELLPGMNDIFIKVVSEKTGLRPEEINANMTE